MMTTPQSHVLRCGSGCEQFVDRPHMVCQSGFHCGCHAERLMGTAELIPRNEQQHGRLQVNQRLAERAGQPRKAPQVHPTLRLNRSICEVLMRSKSGLGDPAQRLQSAPPENTASPRWGRRSWCSDPTTRAPRTRLHAHVVRSLCSPRRRQVRRHQGIRVRGRPRPGAPRSSAAGVPRRRDLLCEHPSDRWPETAARQCVQTSVR